MRAEISHWAIMMGHGGANFVCEMPENQKNAYRAGARHIEMSVRDCKKCQEVFEKYLEDVSRH